MKDNIVFIKTFFNKEAALGWVDKTLLEGIKNYPDYNITDGTGVTYVNFTWRASVFLKPIQLDLFASN